MKKRIQAEDAPKGQFKQVKSLKEYETKFEEDQNYFGTNQVADHKQNADYSERNTHSSQNKQNCDVKAE